MPPFIKTLTGNVYWFTGLSGAGKTTLGKRFYKHLKEALSLSVVFLDGDELREIFDPEKQSFSLDERKKVALRNSKLCKFLADQKIDVVCCTISLFKECQDWNKAHIPNYYEIFVEAPLSVLEKRDSKQIYSRAKEGLLKNVAGVDLKVDFPSSPSLTICNDGVLSPEILVNQLIKHFDLES
jgi:adenylylsulfate kinase-like enzyme